VNKFIETSEILYPYLRLYSEAGIVCQPVDLLRHTVEIVVALNYLLEQATRGDVVLGVHVEGSIILALSSVTLVIMILYQSRCISV
jgi:hypothetical protein